ncbi:MAG TPA: sulfurtransferase [Steroidobacteraceae bacterium]|nr:sulfurtransferase [Steroidobacteraceae bacterium]
MQFARHRAKLEIMEFHTLISVDSLQELLGKPELAVLDCRFDLMNPEAGRQAYLAAHIPGARYADLNRDLSAPIGLHTGRHPLPHPAEFASRLGELGIGNGTQVVAYDDANASYAARLWWMLRWLGHGAVAVLDGGLRAWTAQGGALQPGEVEVQGKHFTPRIDAGAVVSAAELEQVLLNPAAVLVDARAPERYAGTVEPLDPVAGHIPGAVNHPFSANLGADNRFLPAAELERRWQELLAGREPGNLVAMCGSGVTACHNLLSLEVAGLSGAKLYAGSWSEWIRDPRRPVARG